MSFRPIKFVHAADFHLDRPVMGLAEVPEHLADLFVEAPWRAAAKAFDVACAEHADFVLLAGDIVDFEEASPASFRFLGEQFQRLADQQIAVYWAGGPAEATGEPPAHEPWPENVHQFQAGAIHDFIHHIDGRPAARILGTSSTKGQPFRAAAFQPKDDGLPDIAVAHTKVKAESLAESLMHYWALGGKHRGKTLFSGSQTARYSGTTQGRSPAETGEHGCSLVELEVSGRAVVRRIPTDVVRFLSENIEVRPDMTSIEVERLLRERCETLIAETSGIQLIVSYTLVGSGPALADLRRGAAHELAERLRADFGRSVPGLWTTDLSVAPASELLEEREEQDDILGDLLRAIEAHREDPDAPIDLSDFAGDQNDARLASLLEDDEALASLFRIDDPQVREEVLSEVALLSAALLAGEESSQ